MASAGRCVAGRPAPPSPRRAPSKPAQPVGDLAIELLPALGVGLAAEHAIIGFFGEVLGGVRWRRWAALHVGLGAGSLGADRHVVLASAMPQLRPLPPELSIDVVIGVPFGFVNYSHKAYEWVGNVAEETTAADSGFHLGGFVALLGKASDTFSIGPSFQYDRFFAERGSNFFSIALAGCYDFWLAPSAP